MPNHPHSHRDSTAQLPVKSQTKHNHNHYLTLSPLRPRQKNLKTAFSLWKRVICFPSTIGWRNLKRNNQRSFWICVWGNFGQRYRKIIFTWPFFFSKRQNRCVKIRPVWRAFSWQISVDGSPKQAYNQISGRGLGKMDTITTRTDGSNCSGKYNYLVPRDSFSLACSYHCKTFCARGFIVLVFLVESSLFCWLLDGRAEALSAASHLSSVPIVQLFIAMLCLSEILFSLVMFGKHSSVHTRIDVSIQLLYHRFFLNI